MAKYIGVSERKMPSTQSAGQTSRGFESAGYVFGSSKRVKRTMITFPDSRYRECIQICNIPCTMCNLLLIHGFIQRRRTYFSY